MIVMMMASTPSLNASRRVVFTVRCPATRGNAHHEGEACRRLRRGVRRTSAAAIQLQGFPTDLSSVPVGGAPDAPLGVGFGVPLGVWLAFAVAAAGRAIGTE